MPGEVAELYGDARRVDLCYNELVSLKNVELFRDCEELVLDNNQLGDGVTFPRASSVPGLRGARNAAAAVAGGRVDARH